MICDGANIEDEMLYPSNYSIESVEREILAPYINILRTWSGEEDR